MRILQIAVLLIIIASTLLNAQQSPPPAQPQTPPAVQPQPSTSATPMTPYERRNLWLQFATLSVLTITLIVLAVYTGYTRTLAKAAVEQMPTPCVEIFQQEGHSAEAVIEGHSSSISGMDRIAFRNVGTGTASNPRYQIQTSQTQPYSAVGPSLAPGQVFTSGVARNALSDPAIVTCEFQTLSGAKHRTVTVIEGRRWVRSSRFERAT